ncbi:DUF1353 domain-containing protein [Oricola sp.]|uniref:DUF1353 domain-containing protein n=1 Tax=Oricola sp. TaxID=1979950 RepID=UPI003BA8FD78
MASQFVGEVHVRWVGNSGPDRDMQLTDPFGYVDPEGKTWSVPAGTVVNGASIPQFFWTSFGPPFVGDYRRASVVHDHYCVTKTETAKATHRMFHDACRTGGVGALKAKLMYNAVRTFGPNWSGPSMEELPGAVPMAVPQMRSVDEGAFHELERWIEESNPSLDEIDERIDHLGPLLEIPTG